MELAEFNVDDADEANDEVVLNGLSFALLS